MATNSPSQATSLPSPVLRLEMATPFSAPPSVSSPSIFVSQRIRTFPRAASTSCNFCSPVSFGRSWRIMTSLHFSESSIASWSAELPPPATHTVWPA